MQKPVDHHQDRLIQAHRDPLRAQQGTQHTDQVHLTAPTALTDMADMGTIMVEAPQCLFLEGPLITTTHRLE